MAKIIVLGLDGQPAKTKDGQDKFIYSVDGRHLVRAGKLMEVRKIQNINGVKKHMVVAYRPCTAEDKQKVLDAKKAKIAALQAEIGDTENTAGAGTPTEADTLRKEQLKAAAQSAQLAELKKQAELTAASQSTETTAADVPEVKPSEGTENETKAPEGAEKGDTGSEIEAPKGRTRPMRPNK